MNNILTIKNLEYKTILNNIDCSFKENSFNLIIGSNKCGKSTFVKLLCGLYNSKNMIYYKQTDINSLKSLDFSMLMGKVIYNGSYTFNFSCLDQEILFKLDKLNLSSSEKKMKYKNLIKYFNVDKILYTNINELDIFDKIKSLILLELVHTPKILFLDNVFCELSINQSKELIDILKKIGGITLIATSTALDISIYFDNLYVLSKGELLLNGTVIDVLKEDSTLNKIGLELPFMIDLSIKLKYYDLCDDVILDIDRMIDVLWK